MKVNQLKAGAVLSYLSMGLGYLVSIIYTPIMLRLLGQNDYGLYNLVVSVVSYLGILNFGFGSAYMRFYSVYKVNDDKDNIAKLNGMFLIVFLLLGVIAVIAGTTLAFNTDLIFGSKLTEAELSRAKKLMIILVINLAISFPNIVFNSYITANEKFIFQNLVQILRIVVNPFLVIPALLMGYGSVGMAIVTTVLNISIEIFNLIYCISKLDMKFIFINFDFRLMKEMTVFSLYIFINLIVDLINWNVDKFLLGRYHGTVAVAVYGLASQLNTYFLSIMTTISNVFIPRVHRLVASQVSDNQLTTLFTKIGRVQFIIYSLILTGIIFFGRPFINIWAGNDYDNSYFIFLLLVISGAMSSIQTIGIEIQRAKNIHKFRSILYLIIALVNLIASIPLTKMYGGIGAAFGTTLAIIIGNGFIMNYYYHKKVGINIKHFWSNILSFLPSLILPILIGAIIKYYFNLYNIFNFILFGIVYVIIFSTSMWVIGLNQDEKDLIRKPLQKVINRFK